MALDYGLSHSLSALDMDDSVISSCSSSSSLNSSFLESEDFVSNSLIMRADSMESLTDAFVDSDSAEFMAYKNTSALCEDLSFMGGMPEMCDVKFLVGQEKVPVYGVRAILTTRCRGLYNLILAQEKVAKAQKATPKKKGNKILNFLRRRRSGKGCQPTWSDGTETQAGPLTVEVPEFEPSVFNRIVLFIQSGTISVDISNVIGVLNAADTYGLDDLRSACLRFARGFINVKSVLPLYMTTLHQTDFKLTKQLSSEIFAFLDINAEDVFQVEEFEHLPMCIAMSLLSRPIARASAETKWDAALRWSRRHSDGDVTAMRDTLKSFTPNINLLEIPLSKLLDEVTPLCAKLSETGINDTDVAVTDVRDCHSRSSTNGLSSRKSSMSSVCSDSAKSTDSGYTSCKESCML